MSFSSNLLNYTKEIIFCSHYYYVRWAFWKCFIYSEETVHIAHINTTYSWAFLKTFIVIPKRQYNMLTLLLCTYDFFLKMFLVITRKQYFLHMFLLCTDEVLWKFSLIFRVDSTYFSHYYYVQRSFSENILSCSEETVYNAQITTT